MAEWSKAQHWKCCVRFSVPRVRIPPSPKILELNQATGNGSLQTIMKTEKKLTISVLGAGAVGCFYGALLQKSGHHVEYKSQSGPEGHRTLKIKSVWGDFEIDARFHHHTQTMPKSDLILIANKALPGIDYSKILKPVIREDTIIIVLQNGINLEERIREIFPENPIIGAVAFTCINRLSPNEIIHLDYGPVTIAALKKENAKIAQMVAGTFANSKIPIKIEENLRQMRWIKLLWNIPFNPLSVLLNGSDTSRMIRSQDALSLVKALMEETRAIAASDGILISEENTKDMIEKTGKMKPYKTSMLLDYENKKPMEVDAILGEPLNVAQKNNIRTPVIQTIYRMLQFYNENNLIAEQDKTL